MKRNISSILLFLVGVFILSGEFFYFYSALAQNGSITATVQLSGGCGNGIVESGEQCDAGGSNGTCPATCSISCTNNSCGGGGGGGGGGSSTIPSNQVILQGLAYPGAAITVLKDGQVATGGILADSEGNFKISFPTLTAGTYTFGIWAKDKDGRKSITFSFTVTVSADVITTISGIFLPPTIELDKVNLAKGETLKILGQTVSESEISIHIESIQEIVKKTKAKTSGDWNYLFDTTPLEDGMHTTRAKAESPEGLLSSYSNVLAFYVGEGVAPGNTKTADANGDNKVNLVDLSILLYNWGIPKNIKADLNGDGQVNLTDFSIMMYKWTG